MFRTRVRLDKLALYKKHHKGVWPAVEAGLRRAGVELLTIWAPKDGGNVLQMYIEVKRGVDLGRVTGHDSPYWASDTTVPEWEEMMEAYFESGQWEEMDVVYTLTSSTSTNTFVGGPDVAVKVYTAPV